MKQSLSDARTAIKSLASMLVLLTVAGGCSSGDATPATQRDPTPFPTPYVIAVTGSDNLWQVRYPNPADVSQPAKEVTGVRNLHVPLGTQVVLALSSTDYVYTLEIPAYDLKEIAVPEHEFRMEFLPRSAGRLELLGEHLCGDPFSEIPGELVISPPDEFRSWLEMQ